jgi:putative acetyltransferase
VLVRLAQDGDASASLHVERLAFGGGDTEADLVEALLADPTAQPVINLVAEEGGVVVGHALFTCATIEGHIGTPATILAPLAVAPDAQGRGVGQALARAGIRTAGELGIDLVFVLGHIGYYPRFGFEPAAPHGLDAPYPIDPSVADAWMVRAMRPGLLGAVRGTVRCADALMRPELWAE